MASPGQELPRVAAKRFERNHTSANHKYCRSNYLTGTIADHFAGFRRMPAKNTPPIGKIRIVPGPRRPISRDRSVRIPGTVWSDA